MHTMLIRDVVYCTGRMSGAMRVCVCITTIMFLRRRVYIVIMFQFGRIRKPRPRVCVYHGTSWYGRVNDIVEIEHTIQLIVRCVAHTCRQNEREGATFMLTNMVGWLHI